MLVNRTSLDAIYRSLSLIRHLSVFISKENSLESSGPELIGLRCFVPQFINERRLSICSLQQNNRNGLLVFISYVHI